MCIHCIFFLFVQLRFEEDLAITKMYSGEGEEVPFTESMYPKGNVEDWLLNVEAVMRSSLKQIIKDSLDDYVKVCIKRNKFLVLLLWGGL